MFGIGKSYEKLRKTWIFLSFQDFFLLYFGESFFNKERFAYMVAVCLVFLGNFVRIGYVFVTTLLG